MEKINNQPISVFWFRRDLRLNDNMGLFHALSSGLKVLTLFIFDKQILDELSENDRRVTFIYQSLHAIHNQLRAKGSSLCVKYGDVGNVWEWVLQNYNVQHVFANHDYEPYAIQRDSQVKSWLSTHHIEFSSFKDQVIFERNDILKSDQSPYSVYTPYMKKWLQQFTLENVSSVPSASKDNYLPINLTIMPLEQIGFRQLSLDLKPVNIDVLKDYELYRDKPFLDKTSHLSVYLRFGTVSIREMVNIAYEINLKFLQELIWREFFMQILFHFPHVVTGNFKKAYDEVSWINNEEHFKRWCNGTTGYPMVDAGMRQLNETGYMHNRVRMVAAGFLCKHLLTDWRKGEAYFAQHLLDYELSSNNGNWQWAAGTGCDAAPYFRVFNPDTQLKKFDPNERYVKKWIPEYPTSAYAKPIVDHNNARVRAIETYKIALHK